MLYRPVIFACYSVIMKEDRRLHLDMIFIIELLLKELDHAIEHTEAILPPESRREEVNGWTGEVVHSYFELIYFYRLRKFLDEMRFKIEIRKSDFI